MEEMHREYVEEEGRINGIVEHMFHDLGQCLIRQPVNQRIVCETLLRLLEGDTSSHEYKELQDILSKLNQK